MKNIFLRIIGTAALATLMVAAFAQISVSAQDINNDEKGGKQTQEDSLNRLSNARRLEGVWNIQVTRINCQTGAVIANFPAMHVYRHGGTMDDFGAQNSPSLRGPGYGIWNYGSNRHYKLSFQFFRFNADGTLAGRNVARQENELSQDGNNFTQTSVAQAFDVNGNVIGTNCAVATGVRFE